MKIILDSGAFSAFTRKKDIDIEEYIDFIKENERFLESYINLDVIGSAEKSWENQKYLESRGLNPLPVFHHSDDFKWLDKCLEYDHFCLGGIADTPTNAKRVPFLDKCFRAICDKDGIPKSKIHGLGVTSPSLLRRYPFYSVDSTSWLMSGATGVIIIPQKRRGQYVYNVDPFKIAISSGSSAVGYGQHYDTASPTKRKAVDEYLEYKGYITGGPDIPKEEEGSGLYTNHYLRMKLNAEFFRDFMEHLPDYPFAFKPKRQGSLL